MPIEADFLFFWPFQVRLMVCPVHYFPAFTEENGFNGFKKMVNLRNFYRWFNEFPTSGKNVKEI